jgi:hypothetical protein
VGLAPGSVKAYAVVSCHVDQVNDHDCILSENISMSERAA